MVVSARSNKQTRSFLKFINREYVDVQTVPGDINERQQKPLPTQDRISQSPRKYVQAIPFPNHPRTTPNKLDSPHLQQSQHISSLLTFTTQPGKNIAHLHVISTIPVRSHDDHSSEQTINGWGKEDSPRCSIPSRSESKPADSRFCVSSYIFPVFSDWPRLPSTWGDRAAWLCSGGW